MQELAALPLIQAVPFDKAIRTTDRGTILEQKMKDPITIDSTDIGGSIQRHGTIEQQPERNEIRLMHLQLEGVSRRGQRQGGRLVGGGIAAARTKAQSRA